MQQEKEKKVFKKQHQDHQPGIESQMDPLPKYENPHYKPSEKLAGKIAVISGGDSGIGRAVAIAYAKEGADVAILYLEETSDARQVKNEIEALNRRCLTIETNLKTEQNAINAVEKITKELGKINILVNNVAVQFPKERLEDITEEQWDNTFRSNIYSYFFLTKAALPHIEQGSAIINTTSITAFEGSKTLIDYSSTKGAIVAFTRSVAMALVERSIHVNAVAPGPVWTPLIVSSFKEEKVETFGSTVPMGRAAQPYELAPIYVFLASEDASNITGQIFHVNGGVVVN